jgi:hypothetical protein
MLRRYRDQAVHPADGRNAGFQIRVYSVHPWLNTVSSNPKKQGREMNPCPEFKNTENVTDRSGEQFLAKQSHRGQCGSEQHHRSATIRNLIHGNILVNGRGPHIVPIPNNGIQLNILNYPNLG